MPDAICQYHFERGNLVERFQYLPKELRLKVLAYSCYSDRGRWMEPLRPWFPSQFLHECDEAVYNIKELIFDLPDGHYQARYPSEFHIHDRTDYFSIYYAPGFMADTNLADEECGWYIDIKRLRLCPFHAFRKITIRIPSLGSSPAQLIMNWNQLRFIGGLLGSSKYGLPAVEIVFLEERSWIKNGKFTTDGPDPFRKLKLGKEKNTSDVLLLLRALVRLRGAASVDIKTPFPEDSTDAQFSIRWLKNSIVQATPYG